MMLLFQNSIILLQIIKCNIINQKCHIILYYIKLKRFYIILNILIILYEYYFIILYIIVSYICVHNVLYIYVMFRCIIYMCVYHICKYSKYVYNHIRFYLYDLYDI